MNDKTFVSLFRGIGGFDLGLTYAGWECVWSNDINEDANKIYHKNFPQTPGYDGSIQDVNPQDIPDHTLLCGGFPCQPFSLAGKRKGFKDIRGTLFFEIIRVLKAKRPPIFLLENVDGIRNHDNGDTFETILRTLGNLGYILQWEVLDSKCWVPQHRERVFIVGHLGKERFRKIFPLSETYPRNHIPHAKTQAKREWVSTTLYTRDDRGDGTYIMLLDNLGGNIKERIKKADYTWTLGGSETAVSENGCYRKLTPIERERLQGFPDGWTEGVSEHSRVELLGNAVTVPVIEVLGRLLACERCK